MALADRFDLIEREHGEPLTPQDMADSFRTQSYHLMERYPIVGAHLVLAAAALAPTCDDERDVSEEFSGLIDDFAVELGRLHARAKARRSVGGQVTGRGTC
jgi:hypothetical protein